MSNDPNNNLGNYFVGDYALSTRVDGNFTIRADYESLTLEQVKEAHGVHARIPGAFYAPTDAEWAEATGAHEYYLTGDEPVAIPAEIGLHTVEGDKPETFVKSFRVGTAREVSLPSLSTQWRQDWARRVEVLKRRGLATSETLVQRAPQQFIDTGVWPDDVPRP